MEFKFVMLFIINIFSLKLFVFVSDIFEWNLHTSRQKSCLAEEHAKGQVMNVHLFNKYEFVQLKKFLTCKTEQMHWGQKTQTTIPSLQSQSQICLQSLDEACLSDP